MCFFKSQVSGYDALTVHYEGASCLSLLEEIALVKEKFNDLLLQDDALKEIGMAHPEALSLQLQQYTQKDGLPAHLSKQAVTEMRWYQRLLSAYGDDQAYTRWYENGFDYFPSPILTAGEPDKFKFFHWGLVPFFMKPDKAMALRAQTLNCIHEEMWTKPSYRDAAKNGQRCLIPVKGFFEWRWLDDKGTVKIPYYVTFRDQQIRSMAGLYSRWKNPATGQYYYSYTVLTCPANAILDYVHNHKKRMPVFIAPEDEKAWLNRDLKQNEIMDLCRPYTDPAMRAYTISKMLTTRNMDTNVPEVLAPFNYNPAIQEAHAFLQRGEKKKAIDIFKSHIAGEKIKEEHVALAAQAEVKAELALSPAP